jgi:O-antigen ligase
MSVVEKGARWGGTGFELRALAIVLALALQVQATLPFGETGIRVAVSDLLLPIALIYVAVGWGRPSMRPSWQSQGLYWWLLAISAAMTVALLVGHQEVGRWLSWAIINKWGGWFALAGYFLVGGSMTSAGGVELRQEFLRVFLAAAAGIAAVNALCMPWLLTYYTLPFGIEFNRATGGMQNSNAFGFLLVVASLLVVALKHRVLPYLSALLTALWFTSSRGAVLAFLVGLLALLALSPRRMTVVLKPAAVAVLAVIVISVVAVIADPARVAQAEAGQAPIGFFSIERLDPDSDTIEKRRAQNERAVELFASAPLLGHGLGFFVEKTGQTLHNSLLWLVIETGLAGTVAVVGFLFFCVYRLYLGREDPFLLGMVVVAAAFMAMSLSGEFLYQRHLWLLLGMALASPPLKASLR